MAENNEDHESTGTVELVLTPIVMDTSPDANRKLAVVGFLTLAFITTPNLELLDMFCELL